MNKSCIWFEYGSQSEQQFPRSVFFYGLWADLHPYSRFANDQLMDFINCCICKVIDGNKMPQILNGKWCCRCWLCDRTCSLFDTQSGRTSRGDFGQPGANKPNFIYESIQKCRKTWYVWTIVLLMGMSKSRKLTRGDLGYQKHWNTKRRENHN